jgi:excinuclease UvrABC helicase subunit UvrB
MELAARNLKFEEAARLRDEIMRMKGESAGPKRKKAS